MSRRRRVLLICVGTPAALIVLLAVLFVVNGLLLADGESVRTGVTDHAAAAPFKSGELRVLSYNIAKLFMHNGGLSFDSAESVRRRLKRVADVINAEKPDLVFLSEAIRECGPCPVDQVAELAEATGMHAWTFGENYNIGLPFYRVTGGNAILSRRPLEPVLNQTFAGRKPFYITKNNRRALWCRVQVGGRPVLLGAFHNDSFNLVNNAAQVREELAFIGDRDALVAGDFNASPATEPMKLWRESGKFNGVFDGAMTYPADKPTRRIDYILGPAAWTVVEQRVIPTTVSDHRPVLTVFRVPAAEEGTIVHVDKIGAAAGDGKDDGPAIREAIEGLKGQGARRLVFGGGRYDFFPYKVRGRKRPVLAFAGLDGLTVEGQADTVLMFHGIMPALSFSKCRNVTVRNLTIDWERPPFSVGTVKAVGEKQFDVQIEKQFPVAGGEVVEAFMEYDPKTRRPQRRGLDIYRVTESTELIAPQVLRLHLTRSVPVKPGMLLVLRHQVYRNNAISFHDSRDVAVENVRIYTAPGMGITGRHTENITVRKVRVEPRPGSDRIMSTTADATHFNSCSGIIRIEDCYFEGMGDDATNVHGMWHRVTEVVDAKTVVTECRKGWVLPPAPGHVFELTDPKTILPYGTATVASVKIDRKAKVHRVTFAEPLPERIAPGDMLGNTAWAPVLRIKGCVVRHHRARGMLIQTRDAVIEDCRFEGSSGAALHITTDVGYWTESMGTRKVVIRNNVFEGCNYGAAMTSGVINVFAHLPERKYATNPGVHRDLTIEGNTIRNTDSAAMFINAVDGVVVRGNTIENCNRARRRTSGKHAIYFLHSANATVTGNTVKSPGKDYETLVGIGDGTDKSTIKIEGNEGS
jgi:endonuclease/exonuclease/phosphatase family metal-dependent hydrolase